MRLAGTCLAGDEEVVSGVFDLIKKRSLLGAQAWSNDSINDFLHN